MISRTTSTIWPTWLPYSGHLQRNFLSGRKGIAYKIGLMRMVCGLLSPVCVHKSLIDPSDNRELAGSCRSSKAKSGTGGKTA